MDRTLEEMLVELCAPTLAGMKPANLFRCPETPGLFRSIREWNERLHDSGLRIRVMKRCRVTHTCLIYICRWDWIQRVLTQKKASEFLKSEDYDISKGMESVLCQLAHRLCVQQDFPHEIGVFLGYPLRDVIGFIENNGQNYSCCGHWKCYGDAAEAQKTFDSYRKCTDCYKRLYARGIPLMKLIAAA